MSARSIAWDEKENSNVALGALPRRVDRVDMATELTQLGIGGLESANHHRLHVFVFAGGEEP